jgi:tetrahydromethanopterin S-methyltransferase subunit D
VSALAFLHPDRAINCCRTRRTAPASSSSQVVAGMIESRIARLVSILLVLFCAGCAREVSFKSDVEPILKARCQSCHSPGGEGYAASGFSVANYSAVMKGTRYGPVVVAGNSVGSTLSRLIEHKADPSIAMPKSSHPNMSSEYLPQTQIDLIKKWIDQGAKDN